MPISEGPAPTTSRLHLLTGVLHEFLEELRARDRSPDSLTWYEGTIRQQVRWLQEEEGIGHLEHVTKAAMTHFLGTQAEAGVSPARRHGHWRAMRAFLRWADQEDYELHKSLFKGSKFAVFEPDVPEKPKGRYSQEQIEDIFEAIAEKPARGKTRQRDAMIVAIYIGSGIRLRGLAGLTVDDIEQNDEGQAFLRVTEKGRKTRWVPIKTKLRRDLERYIHRHRPESKYPNVFLQANGEPLAPRGIQAAIQRIDKELAFHIHSHAFRHHFGTTYASKPGTNLERLRRIMGHESFQTTLGYVKLNRDDLAEDIERLAPDPD